jgi:hypothetical protein
MGRNIRALGEIARVTHIALVHYRLVVGHIDPTYFLGLATIN